uniref:homeobox protein engrailed-1-like n=1 Tax=Panthera onca TaxID=9690 RepID=UPI00295443F1|nr:homeobox protein engrailed-1-like [Panthera onca]
MSVFGDIPIAAAQNPDLPNRVLPRSLRVRASGAAESGSSSLSLQLSPGTKTSSEAHGDGRRMDDGDAASCCRETALLPTPPHPTPPANPASLCPHPLPHGESGPDRAAPPCPTHPAPSPPLGPGSFELHKATCRALRCPGRGGERGGVPLGRGQDTGARRDQQHRPHAAAAAAEGYFAAPTAGSGGDRPPPSPPPEPLALPALRSARSSRLRCPATATVKRSPAPCALGEPRTPGTRRRRDWLSKSLAPPPRAAPLPRWWRARRPAPSRGAAGGWGPGLGEASCGHGARGASAPGLRALQFLGPRPARKKTGRPGRKRGNVFCRALRTAAAGLVGNLNDGKTLVKEAQERLPRVTWQSTAP